MADDDLNFEFEAQLERKAITTGPNVDNRHLVEVPPQEFIGQQPGNYRKNFKKTVCTYWLRGMCMKGEACGFLHQYDVDKMPICRNLLKYGECKELDCPYKHDTEEIKECNMYKLGFCIYGPQCRFKHKPASGPPPPVALVEAAKPLGARDINRVVNSVNPGVLEDNNRLVRPRWQDNPPAALPPPNNRPKALSWSDNQSPNQANLPQPPTLALPAPPPGNPLPGSQGVSNAIPGPRPPPGGPRPPSHPPPPHLSAASGPKPPASQPPSDAQQGPGQQANQQQGSQQQQQGQQGLTGMPGLLPGQGNMPGIMPGPGAMQGMPGMGGAGFPMGMMNNPMAMMMGLMGGAMPPNGMMMGQGGMGNVMMGQGGMMPRQFNQN